MLQYIASTSLYKILYISYEHSREGIFDLVEPSRNPSSLYCVQVITWELFNNIVELVHFMLNGLHPSNLYCVHTITWALFNNIVDLVDLTLSSLH
jgi:hypothetical protein